MTRAKRHISRQALLAPRHWGTIVEAGAALVIVSLATRLLPFKSYIGVGARRLETKPARSGIEEARIIDAIANRAPFRAVCLQRGLALQWMLRRRGIDAVLHYGVQLKPDGQEIAAHVWVSVDGDVLLGAPQHLHYTEVARYPRPKV